jgi:hypothetical protein
MDLPGGESVRALCIAIVLAGTGAAHAQVCGVWETAGPVDLLAGVTGTVRSLVWHGTAQEGRALVSGQFKITPPQGTPTITDAAYLGPSGWEPGPQVSSWSAAAAVEAGVPVVYMDVFVQGAYRVHRYDGNTLAALPGGFNSLINTLAAVEEGGATVLYAGGSFTAIDGVPVSRIARWTGSQWEPLGAGIDGSRVDAIAISDVEGVRLIYAGGSLNGAGGVVSPGLVRWNGSQWSASPAGPLVNNLGSPNVRALSGATGSLVVGGIFHTAGGVVSRHIVRLTSQGWQALGPGLVQAVRCIETEPTSSEVIYAGGSGGVERWDGASWAAIGPVVPTGGSVAEVTDLLWTRGPDPRLLVGGNFTRLGGVWSRGIVALGPGGWEPAPLGTLPVIHCMQRADIGEGEKLYVGGSFDRIGGIAAESLAAWDGQEWEPVGSGIEGEVWAINGADLGSGPRLYAAGVFSRAGGTVADNIASWNGQAWEPLGAGVSFIGSNTVPGSVRSLAVSSVSGSPRLYAGGAFASAGGAPQTAHVAAWDGNGWSSVGIPGIYFGGTFVLDFDLPSPGLVAMFPVAGPSGMGDAIRWNGTNWTTIANFSPGGVQFGALVGDGAVERILAAGSFASNSGLPMFSPASYDGASWAQMGTLALTQQTAFTTGRSEVPGEVFGIGGSVMRELVRWTGTMWETVPGLLAGYDAQNIATCRFDDGSGEALYIGGASVFGATALASPGIVRFRFCPECYPNCDASTVAPVLNVADFTCFLQRFAAGDSYANCDGSTTAPVLNVADFTCFLQRFATGCP